jgi:hypothetical protein
VFTDRLEKRIAETIRSMWFNDDRHDVLLDEHLDALGNRVGFEQGVRFAQCTGIELSNTRIVFDYQQSTPVRDHIHTLLRHSLLD